MRSGLLASTAYPVVDGGVSDAVLVDGLLCGNFMGKDTSEDDITKVGRLLHFSLQEGIKDLGKTF